ncbi:hypothetical protein [Anabaena sp. 4-3]|uniref:hypothetical protein n=1 Tax=Anabaena sp. 4-3 TaxID=1811979 RepID=UPI000835439D|nr:hypothetical protein [Anabaena sp. 4-3]
MVTKTNTNAIEQLTYTAVELARELGTSDTNIRTNWFPKLEEIWWWCVADLKDGERYTATAREKFFELQEAISPKVPVRSPDNIILRNDDGKPLMQNNPNRIGIAAYKDKVWQKYNRIPPQRVDAPTAEVLAQIPVEAEICDESSIILQEQGLARIDELGQNVDNLFDLIDQAATANANALVGRYAEKLTTTVQAGISNVHANLGKAMNSRTRQKS